MALHSKGNSAREIAKAVGVSRNSVRPVLRGVAAAGSAWRASRLETYLEDIRVLHQQCMKKNGRSNLVRVLEKLRELAAARGERLEASYSALTWFCREHGIGVTAKEPVRRIITEPGEEMQHDTSLYTILLGGKKVKRQCASLIYGYSRMAYVQFYPQYTRFQSKIFLTEAFQYLQGVCRRCVIDNTSVILACGAGQQAQIAPEMEAFEERYGFRFMAHEIMDSDRKGKVERPFDYIEGNFLVGRTFRDDADLNRQALGWVEAANRRRMREFKASPVELFAAERGHLVPLPIYIPEVYRIWQRSVDSYGCFSLHGLKYPAPAAYIGRELVVRETKDRVILLDGRIEVVSHPKKSEGSPPPPQQACAPRRQKAAQLAEEGKLKALGSVMAAYLEALKANRGPRYSWSLKKLYRLLCQYKGEDLLSAVGKAAEHGLYDINRLETILLREIAARDYFLPLGAQPEDYEAWPQYQQGAATPEPDLSKYAPTEEDKDDR